MVPSIRKVWRKLPIPFSIERKLKRAFLGTIPLTSDLVGSNSSRYFYVPKARIPPVINKQPVRLIAFYLPQFHPIPENNEWWGEGFTDWINVKKGTPQFAGHYQPHIPDELGYYDLRDISVMQVQADIAKLYGVGGFCFYFYWFGGKRLLEQPLLQYLDSQDIDFPFCLCWANENWSRRWSGLDSEILISQNHSEADDLGFIKYLSNYLKDKRYIRIHNKPLVLVYRPNLLPSALETAGCWRKWCRENGIGEIFLAYVQSFESVDPEKYGFDAAIEFPPNYPLDSEGPAPTMVTSNISDKLQSFTGKIFDWSDFVERSKGISKSKYTLFRAVNPSWDNTARRKNDGTIFYNSNPLGYQQWLFNSISHTVSSNDDEENNIVFVNAWNEWAEGAHLEPDQRYGYSYLEATCMALQYVALQSMDFKKDGPLAIIIHAYYVDIFEEILNNLANITLDIKLFVTTIYEQVSEVESLINKHQYNYYILGVENRGRDILPFLKMLPKVLEGGHEIFLKLHTKKSRHRKDGDAWRNDIFSKLFLHGNPEKIVGFLQNNESVGMVGPSGHIISMESYWGSNKDKVLQLSARLGVDVGDLSESNFVAGTMFYARVMTMIPLLNLAISENDFEEESGQLDGTFAHAFERVLSSLSLIATNKKLVGSDLSKRMESKEKNNEYRFAREEGYWHVRQGMIFRLSRLFGRRNTIR